MTQPLLQPSVDILSARELHLVEEPPPQLSPDHQRARDLVWDEKAQGNPGLFDGPVVACAGVDQAGPDTLVLRWTRVTYRHYALRWVPDAHPLPSLFVDVLQPTDDGALLAGRMSPLTAAPGRWQLPGGSVEYPDGNDPLDTAALRHNAARELAEEIGIDTSPQDLTLWGITRGTTGNIGVHFVAPRRPASLLRERFEAVVSSATASGIEPELDQIAFVQCPADLGTLHGPHVDYLGPVVHQYAQTNP
ncbi:MULTISPECIES: NUDIX hydrolase [unclassified Streptomyces]|uniref:NUDIX hydrolase n=1 Tax=unclassified Streptomyces TaxID=2593676 RepID=UPI00366130ED